MLKTVFVARHLLTTSGFKLFISNYFDLSEVGYNTEFRTVTEVQDRIEVKLNQCSKKNIAMSLEHNNVI